MSVTWMPGYEERATPFGDQVGYELTHHAMGSETTGDIITAAAANLDATYQGFYLQGISLDHLGGGVWEVKVTYGPTDWAVTFTSTTTGGTIHRDYSYETVQWYDAGGIGQDNTPLFDQLIGVNNNEVTGVDLVTPKEEITITKQFVAADLAANYSDTVRAMTGKVNDDTVTFTWFGQTKTYQPGELLFHGASEAVGRPNKSGAIRLEFTFKFEWSKNIAGLTIGPITDIDKKGWEYLWVYYRPAPAGAVNALVRIPVAVYIERVYLEADFGDLGVFD